MTLFREGGNVQFWCRWNPTCELWQPESFPWDRLRVLTFEEEQEEESFSREEQRYSGCQVL